MGLKELMLALKGDGKGGRRRGVEGGTALGVQCLGFGL